MQGSHDGRRGWTFLTNHAHVLVCIAQDPGIRVQEISERVGITLRSAQGIVGDLVDDGATLQMGIGAIPGAVCAALLDKKDLGVHTEMFTDGVVDLVEAGVINGSRKERNRGKIVAAFMNGSARLYEFARDNPMVEMRPVDFTNDTAVIRTFRKMTAINSAIEVTQDRISLEQHPLAKHAKDFGSAAVMLALINAALVWLLVLFG